MKEPHTGAEMPALAFGAASLVIPLVLFERLRPFAFVAIIAVSPFSGLGRALSSFRYLIFWTVPGAASRAIHRPTSDDPSQRLRPPGDWC